MDAGSVHEDIAAYTTDSIGDAQFTKVDVDLPVRPARERAELSKRLRQNTVSTKPGTMVG